MPPTTNSGIKTLDDGRTFIPASKRADGSTRKAIRVRPGFTPQEDVETYKSRNAEAWKNRGSGGVPGVEDTHPSGNTTEAKSKSAKRREAAKRRQQEETSQGAEDDLAEDLEKISIEADATSTQDMQAAGNDQAAEEAERQKKIRNLLKKLGGVKELKDKKNSGVKLSPDQLMKLGREHEILRDLKKLGHTDLENSQDTTSEATVVPG